MKSTNLLSLTVLIISFVAIPLVFNACGDPAFEAAGKVMSTSCRYKPSSKAFPNSGNSAFTANKMAYDKLDSDSEYTILIDNNCIKNSIRENKPAFITQLISLSSIEPSLRRQAITARGRDLLGLDIMLRDDYCVLGVSKTQYYRTTAITDFFNDTQIEAQKHLPTIKTEESFNYFYNNLYGIQRLDEIEKVKIAILDTGVNVLHPDLQNVMWDDGSGNNGVNAVTLGVGGAVEEATNYDIADISPVQHGTHVAALAAGEGNNNYGITGVAQKGVSIMGVQVFFLSDPLDPNSVVSNSSTIVKGIYWAIQNKADIINMSLGGAGEDPAIEQAISDAIANGVFVVAAAGNASADIPAQAISSGFPIFPAFYGGNYDGMITVGSTNALNNSKSSFSHWSNTRVEISAPGSTSESQGILSAASGSDFRYLRGTSQAAPLVSGSAALVIGMVRANYMASPTPQQVENILEHGSEKIPSLVTFFKDGNSLNLYKLFGSLQQSFPLVNGGVDTGIDLNSCP